MNTATEPSPSSAAALPTVPAPKASDAAAPRDPETRDPETEAAPAPEGVLDGRSRIDAIDAELIELISRRVAVSAQIQASRLSSGGRRLDLRRETEVIGRYTRELGRPGTSVAMALLELGRGRV
jgi:chorismate mutase